MISHRYVNGIVNAMIDVTVDMMTDVHGLVRDDARCAWPKGFGT